MFHISGGVVGGVGASAVLVLVVSSHGFFFLIWEETTGRAPARARTAARSAWW
jgi:hypothetical protein